MQTVLDMKDREDGFLLKDGVPQHMRNLNKPHHRAHFEQVFKPQWCHVNMGADGVHENMSEY